MKHLIILGLLFCYTPIAFSQVPRGEELMGLYEVSTIDLPNVTDPIIGSIVYNPTDEKVYVYTTNGWKALGADKTDLQFNATTGVLNLTNPLTPSNQVNFTDYFGYYTNTNSNSNLQEIAQQEINGSTTSIQETVTNFGQNPSDASISFTNEAQQNSSVQLISADTDNAIQVGSDGGAYIFKNKSYVQTFKTSKSFTNGTAQLLNLFPQVTIQPNKQVYVKFYVPTRNDTNHWGGLFVNINAKVNGTWYNLGNTGYDGGVMMYNGEGIHALNHEMLLDFITHLGLPDNQSYTLQFELTARSYNGTAYVNVYHDLNRTANNLNSRGNLSGWGSDQNYCHIIIQEKDR